MEQQLGEKPPRTSTCPLEENPGPAEPPYQRPPGLGHSRVCKNVNSDSMKKDLGTGIQKLFLKNLFVHMHKNKDTSSRSRRTDSCTNMLRR